MSVSAGGNRRGVAEGPHALEIVEAADLGAEEVHDHVGRVDQHPVGLGQPFEPHRTVAFALDPLGELLRHGRDLASRSTRGDDHVVGNARLAGERDRDDVLRLILVQLVEHQCVQRAGLGLSGGRALRALFGHRCLRLGHRRFLRS